MNTHRAEIAERITHATAEITALAYDRSVLEGFDLGAREAVASIAHLLRQDVELDRIEATPAAIGYARLLAQRDISITVLERGYRLVQDTVVHWCLEELAELSDDAKAITQTALAVTTMISARTNAVSEQLLSVYDSEREMWLLNRNTSRSARIGDILEGRPIEVGAAESALGYRLDQHHLGMIIWTDVAEKSEDELILLELSVTALAERLGAVARPLFEPRDEHTAWAWLPLGHEKQVDVPGLAEIVAGWDRPVTVALGEPQRGVGGFVRTHRQAVQARMVAQASRMPRPCLVPITDVGAVALMCSDLDAASDWVSDLLGPLAYDDPASAQLRETLREFLSRGGSYTAAGTALHMHKNSVAYRIHKIEDQLGHAVREQRLELENALALCYWLGETVLAPNPEEPGAAGRGPV
ncbi:MAG: helix-turn-helix domain-containing protein [Rhodococcus sp. (in: high G+C Gram-positive bacteria)]|uniref:PucR family transcriptional regulator n=1 Tax=Rhodococcus sp. TaxID=1831 RepID=UPI003BB06CAE